MHQTSDTASALAGVVGEANVIKDPEKLKAYRIDGKTPKIVVSPGTIDEVSKVVAYANQHGLEVIPRGNGTKIETGGLPGKTGIVLLTGRLNRITDKDCDNLTLSVESGITLSEVQNTLAKEGRGYFLPLDPPFSQKATLGGIVATNSSGPRRLLYGTARDLITGIKAVYPNGDIVVSGGKTVKNVSGYDMCKLLIGSFGTLAVISEITFRLLPLPEKEATLLVSFVTLDRAHAFAREIRHSQLLPASVEILNFGAMTKMRGLLPVPEDGNYLVAVGLEGVSESVERQIVDMEAMGKKQGAVAAMTLDSDRQRPFWLAVRDLSEKLRGEDPNLVTLKSSFSVSRDGEMLESFERLSLESGLDSAMICHSGIGVLNTYLMVGKNIRLKSASLIKLIEKLTDEAVKNEGNLVVESSPLAIKREVGVWGPPRGDFEIMRRLKAQIDPANTLNPGRFVGGI